MFASVLPAVSFRPEVKRPIMRTPGITSFITLPLLLASFATAQTRSMPPDYAGVQIHVGGIFVTPVPSAPFSADVTILSHQKLTDGSEVIRTTTNHIARDSQGRIYNESRALMPTSFKGEPRLTSAHIFDPITLHNIFYNPQLRVARDSVMPASQAARQPRTPPVPGPSVTPNGPAITVTSLGQQIVDGTMLVGTLKQRTVPAPASSTGAPVTITDEYWYSPDLFVYLIVKHNDPRTGEQIVAVTHIDRAEPPASRFQVPDGYKIVDETPPPPPTSIANPASR
jgi:hypothetical protein